MNSFEESLRLCLEGNGDKDLLSLYNYVANAALNFAGEWHVPGQGKRACYFSAEFLLGRVIYQNLLNLGVLEDYKCIFEQNGLDINMFEQIEDAALGNGGLGRLAACFLDSAATHGLPLDGFGIRYKYGLFKQYFEDGFQQESADDWTRFGDPWSIRREHERVRVDFAEQSVWAVPYDMPIIGNGGHTVNTLRLWQAEAVEGFDFAAFGTAQYESAFQAKNLAEAISSVLYPNDETAEGKRLRIKQEYFFSSASLKSILRRFKSIHGNDFSKLANVFAIQLNDTHPAVAIPELLRLLMEEESLSFEQAFATCLHTFAYTNHTIMSEALERWDAALFCSVIPEVYPYVVMIQNHLQQTLRARGITGKATERYDIVDRQRSIHMARLAIYASHSTNGVARLHTEILKNDALKDWYDLYPERFSNKTNGISQRRWLALCNPRLASLITEKIGDKWIIDLTELTHLKAFADDNALLGQLNDIKRGNKQCLADYVRVHENGFELRTDFVFDIQAKRLHEYKRQLLNAFSILDIYYSIKEGSLVDFHPTTFLFGAKAAPGYRRAKGIIKLINEIAKLINHDSDMKDKLQVLFIQNYSVSYAEKLVPAADISEQISTAGTEASGTGNMKFMLNGAVTLGTYDGANIEIVEQAGDENNYIFGARIEDVRRVADSYNPKQLYINTPRIRRVMDCLIDGTLSDGGTGLFRELFDSILNGASWHRPDQYYLLLDFEPYVEEKRRANKAYCDRNAFARQCLLNIANAGFFSSDRTVKQYADEIWGV